MNWVLDNLDLDLGADARSPAPERSSPIILGLRRSRSRSAGWRCAVPGCARRMLTVTGLLYTIPSLALFAILRAARHRRISQRVNLIVALTIYAIAIMARSVADGLGSVDPACARPATAVGLRRRGDGSGPSTSRSPVRCILAGLRVTAVSARSRSRPSAP